MISKTAKHLVPDRNGNYPCPYCPNKSLVPILREWMNPPQVTDYLCHHCQIGFKIKVKGGIDLFV